MTEATLVRERMLDMLASKLGLDPAEIRRRNLIPAEAMPFEFPLNPDSTPVAPIKYESGDFPGSFELLLQHAGLQELRSEQAARRARGEAVGIGIATFVEIGAIGPFEEAVITTADDGRLTVHVGVSSLGQGVETVLAQIAADVLGVPPENIAVDLRDTDAVPLGFGSFASRSTLLAGNATAIAARELLAQAGTELGVPPDRLEIVDGEVRGPGDEMIPLGKLEPARGRFEKAAPSFSFGAALSVVSVEPETGRVRVLKHVVLQDVGRAVNPALVRGQLAGAAAQGIGGALLEELRFDDLGQPLSTSFADYLLPTVGELPSIDVIVVENPTPTNPLGVKGAGESGMVGTPAAISNAVADALEIGTESLPALPLTPHRVREFLRTRAARPGR